DGTVSKSGQTSHHARLSGTQTGTHQYTATQASASTPVPGKTITATAKDEMSVLATIMYTATSDGTGIFTNALSASTETTTESEHGNSNTTDKQSSQQTIDDQSAPGINSHETDSATQDTDQTLQYTGTYSKVVTVLNGAYTSSEKTTLLSTGDVKEKLASTT